MVDNRVTSNKQIPTLETTISKSLLVVIERQGSEVKVSG